MAAALTAPAPERPTGASALTSVGLFAGIGGIELGLAAAGFRAEVLCEIDPFAQAVLRAHFPGVRLETDVDDLAPSKLPKGYGLLAAGFPCQDISQAGLMRGVGSHDDGADERTRSGLIWKVLNLVEQEKTAPEWFLLENVPNLLRIDKGKALRAITQWLDENGFMWAYRVMDSRAFGLPQRRQRIYILASRKHDPRPVFFGVDAGEPGTPEHEGLAVGFYWTEGRGGLGWAVDAVPTLKNGSTIGLASPPAIWLPDGNIVKPDIRDGERLQGFAEDWTLPAMDVAGAKPGARWKQVGNAVSVPVAAWIGQRLVSPGRYDPSAGTLLVDGEPWPVAAWGGKGKSVRASGISMWPIRVERPHLADFLNHGGEPLSERATRGFLKRLNEGSMKPPADFKQAIERHLNQLGARAEVAPMTPTKGTASSAT